VIGYVGSAAIVVLIIVVHYLTSYDPQIDPFQKDIATSGPSPSAMCRANPFDVSVLSMAENFANIVAKAYSFTLPPRLSPQHNRRLAAAFIKVRESYARLADFL
jgi:hypothetical protein